MVAVLVWRCCVARTRVTRAVWCLSARALRRLPLRPFGTFRSGPSAPSARPLRRLPLGLCVVAAYPAWFPKNVARNSPASISDFEIVSLGLQRLWGVSKNDQVKLRATFFCAGLEARPGPADTHWCRRRVLLLRALAGTLVAAYPAWFPKNVARNSPANISDFEIVSLGLQRLWGVSKNDQVKLRATFRGAGLGRSWARGWGAAGGSEPVHQRQFISASSAARCRRAFRRRRSTGACAR